MRRPMGHQGLAPPGAGAGTPARHPQGWARRPSAGWSTYPTPHHGTQQGTFPSAFGGKLWPSKKLRWEELEGVMAGEGAHHAWGFGGARPALAVHGRLRLQMGGPLGVPSGATAPCGLWGGADARGECLWWFQSAVADRTSHFGFGALNSRKNPQKRSKVLAHRKEANQSHGLWSRRAL